MVQLVLALLAFVLGGPAPAAPAAPVAPAAPAAAAAADWPTYHGDNARTGVASSPRLSTLHRAWAKGLDGAVYASPLIVGGRVYVATENDSVYAFTTAGRQLWRRHVGTPVRGSSLPCGNIDPSGITGTPAIDVARHELFAVAFVSGHRHQLVGIDTRSGRLRMRKSADPGGFDATVEQERGALLVAHGRVYVPYGGLFGDCGDYHGWVVSRTESGGVLRAYRNPAPQAGIWAPGGIALDSGGNLLVATGNGAGGFAYQSSVIRLSPALKRLAFYAPHDWQALSASDTDVGSVQPAPLAGGLVFQAGKSGLGYLLAPGLGGIGASLQSTRICQGAYGGTAYSAPLVLVPCTDGLVAVRVAGQRFSVAWRASGLNAGPPIVAGGAAWSIDRDTGRLTGYDLASGRQVASAGLGGAISFPTPAASGGLLVAPAGRTVVALTGV